MKVDSEYRLYIVIVISLFFYMISYITEQLKHISSVISQKLWIFDRHNRSQEIRVYTFEVNDEQIWQIRGK